jgi:hypothetical protein
MHNRGPLYKCYSPALLPPPPPLVDHGANDFEEDGWATMLRLFAAFFRSLE